MDLLGGIVAVAPQGCAGEAGPTQGAPGMAQSTDLTVTITATRQSPSQKHKCRAAHPIARVAKGLSQDVQLDVIWWEDDGMR